MTCKNCGEPVEKQDLDENGLGRGRCPHCRAILSEVGVTRPPRPKMGEPGWEP